MQRRWSSLLSLTVLVAVWLALTTAQTTTALSPSNCYVCVRGLCSNTTNYACTCLTGYNGTNCDQCATGYEINAVDGHDLPVNVGTDANMTPQYCLLLCNASSYAGLQDGNTCWCGATFGKYGEVPVDSLCNISCSGNSSLVCGGSSLNSIYSVTNGKYVGCYRDALNGTQCLASVPIANPGTSTPTPVIDMAYAQVVLYVVFSIICAIFGSVTIIVIALWIRKKYKNKNNQAPYHHPAARSPRQL